MKQLFILLLSLSLLTSCYNANYPQAKQGDYAKTNPEEIVIYTNSINQDYEIISMVGTDVPCNPDELLEHLKKKAAKLGADAIIHFSWSGPNYLSERVGASGVAIKLKPNYTQLSINQ